MNPPRERLAAVTVTGKLSAGQTPAQFHSDVVAALSRQYSGPTVAARYQVTVATADRPGRHYPEPPPEDGQNRSGT